MRVVIQRPEEVKKAIIVNGHSLRTFAKTIGISSGYLSQILRGDRNPSGKVAKTISDELGFVFEDYFFVEDACKS